MKKRFAEVKKITSDFKKGESGATLVEYAAAVGMVLLVGILAFQSIGTQANTNFTNTATAITPA